MSEKLISDESKMTKPALRYHGGKFRLAPWIMSFFPVHSTYVEPFGGAASVLLQKERCYAEIYNDLDSSVADFFRVLRYHWTQAAAARALDLLHPTGNPYLDMCMLKGGFPSRKRQYCTEYLKTQPLTAYQIDLIDEGNAVWSWQGVRIDESESRRQRLQGTGACVKSFEVVGGGLFHYRPILRWNVSDVFFAHELAGVEPNPLYKQGLTRVGCMPCINCGKEELRTIAVRFPEHIERIAAWERLVSEVCRPYSPVSFFHMGTKGHFGQKSTIHSIVEWSRTTRGGRQFNLLEVLDEPTACSSAYGLCE